MSTQNENSEVLELEVIGHNAALESMERASIDVQIATAHKFKRDIAAVKRDITGLATLDQETASGCFYTLPGRKGGDGKPIQGPSVRLAEIALASYGNIRAASRIIADDGKFVTAQAVCHDLEKNTCISVEVKRRVTTKDGKRFSDDMIAVTGNAACSIALRNAVFRVVPMLLIKPAFDAAKRVAIGDAKTLSTRRSDAVAHFTKMGVTKEAVFKTIGVSGIDAIGLEHLELLIGYATAIKDGQASIEDIFNKPEPEVAKPLFDDKRTATATDPTPAN